MAKKKLAPGFGSVTKLGGKVKRTKPFRATVIAGYKEDGKAIRKTIGYYATYEEGIEALIEYNNSPINLDEKTITLKEVFELWKPDHYENVGIHSQKKYDNVFNKHLEPLHHMRMRDIKVDQILSLMRNQTRAVQYDIKVVMNMLFKWADKRDIVIKNYAALVEIGEAKIVKGNEIERKTFTLDEIEELWDNVHEPYVDTALILLYTGMRINELLELKVEDVHLDEGYIFTGSKSTKVDKRIIPIHSKIRHLIEARLEERKPYLITTMNGKPMTYSNFLKLYWYNITDHYCHDTRHTFITRMTKCGANPIWLRKIVGHSDKNMTEHYTHANVEILLEEVQKLHY